MSAPRRRVGTANPRRPRPCRRPRLRPTEAARLRAFRVALAACKAKEAHGRRGDAADQRGDAAEVRARLRAMEAHRAVALRWLRVAFGKPVREAGERGEGL